MSGLKRLFNLNIWNIGFIEKPISSFIQNDQDLPEVKWLQHPYKDRFFADPFILSVTEDKIEVLVEEFLYSQKKGKISKLTIGNDYTLIDKVTINEQKFHQSYPFIIQTNNETFILPEASKSGALYKYRYDLDKQTSLKPELLLSEPLLDSTLWYYDSKWWLFAHKRGHDLKNNLYLYYADSLNDPFIAHEKNPVKRNDHFSRPGGNIISFDEQHYRISQVCENSYGEAIRIWRIDELTTHGFEETLMKEIHLNDPVYNQGFHTLNGMKDLCVLDGLKSEFTPFRRIWYELKYRYASRSLSTLK